VLLASPNRRKSGTGLKAVVQLQNGTPNEVVVDNWDIAGVLQTQSCEKLRFGAKFPWAPNVNSIKKIQGQERLSGKRKNFYFCQG